VYGIPESPDRVLVDLESVLAASYRVVTFIPYASQRVPEELFPYLGGGNRAYALCRQGTGVDTYSLSFQSRQRGRKGQVVHGRFLLWNCLERQDVYVVATVDRPEFVRKALLPPFVRYRRPVQLPLLSHDFLARLLRHFRNKYSYADLTVQRATLRSRFEPSQQKAGSVVIPAVSWPNLSLDAAFQYAADQNAWFKSLTFETVRDGHARAEVTVSRDGVLRTTGELQDVYEGLLLPICRKLATDLDLFVKRSRRDTPKLGTKPLRVVFEDDILARPGEQDRFIGAMRLLERASVSVLHNNPHIQLSVLDYDDGSVLDVWVLSGNETVIVPQLRGSAAAIFRLVGHIFHNYAEGVVEDLHVRGQV